MPGQVNESMHRQEEELKRYIGDQLRAFREDVGLTQKELARSIGLTRQKVQRYECGAHSIPSSTLAIIAAELGVAPADFYPQGDMSNWEVEGELGQLFQHQKIIKLHLNHIMEITQKLSKRAHPVGIIPENAHVVSIIEIKQQVT